MANLKLFIIGLCAVAIMASDPMEDPKLFEGDMVLTEDQKREHLYGSVNYQIPLAATKTNLWPTTIPYSMAPEISSQSWAVRAINAAIADYERYTCLRFVKHTTEHGYIYFYKGGGCSSPVGYFRRRNKISLGRGCLQKGTIMHEMAHSLGFYHEQSRPDRDNHVTIKWENIEDGMDYNFRKQPAYNIDSMSVPYDYESVMHYGKYAFGRGKITIETKDPTKQNVIGNREGFSKYDIKQMNLLYQCTGVDGTKPPTTEPACFDAFPDHCPKFQRSGYCSQDKYKDYLNRKCKKSCGFCDDVTTAAPVVTTSAGIIAAPVTYAAPGAAPSAACADVQVTGCPRWQKAGYCTHDRYKKYMKNNCKKSCSLCGGSATTAGPGGATTQPPVSGNCGKPEVAQSRVIAGIDAKKGSWPWQILMLFNGRTMCGGSLVAPQWVVTAAHCVSGREQQARYFKVRVGEHITSTTNDGQHQDIGVEKIISHPNYLRSTLDSDIALMKLSSPVQFSKYVKPVCLPNQDQHVPVGTQCYITGWGKIQHPGNMHHTLQQGKMPIVSKDACSRMNTKNLGIRITDNMVCAGHGGATRVSGCQGDSGGPFVCQTGAGGSWVLHGAVSWGSGRCDATAGYSVFARVAKFKSWIDREMARH